MNTRAPSRGRILVMTGFAGSCVGLLLFLWISFGGSVPLVPQGYRLRVEFNQAVQLGAQSDVRISGVSVGKVVSVGLDRRTGRTRAVLEIGSRFAPRPADTRAVLRQKSLLGETYVELSFGNPRGPMLPDNARLPESHVTPIVQLDQILNTFDPSTRQAFETWMQQDGIAFTGRGEDFNSALAELYPFATNVDAVLAVLRRDASATSTLLHDGAGVFASLARSPAALQGLVRNADTTFAATAAQASSLAAAVRAFPPFLIATRQTISRVRRFSSAAKPLIDQLRPAAVQLSPALVAIAALAPHLRDALTYLGPLNRASGAGVPALERFLEDTRPLFARLTPYLGSVVPVIDYVDAYKREVAAFFANGTASTQAVGQNVSQTKLLHYARVSAPVNPETLTAYSGRPESNRSNAYMEPGGYDQLRGGLPTFGAYLCTSHPLPGISSSVPADLAAVLRAVYFTSEPNGPPCRPQPPLGATLSHHAGLTQLSGQFPHLQPLP